MLFAAGFAGRSISGSSQQLGHESDAVRAQLGAISAEAARLSEQLVELAWREAHAEQDELIPRIGWLLVNHGRQDLWQLTYLEFNRDNSYVLGDKVRFLLGQPPATPVPLQGPEGGAT